MNNFETIYIESSSYLSSHTHDNLYYTKSESEALFWHAGNDGPGSGADADLIYKSTGNLHASAFAGLGVPTGLIILWYGAVGDIPSGWQLANGTGTVDLRDRFPVGAGTTFSAGATGGSTTFASTGTISVTSHTLSTDEMGAHTHPFTDSSPSIGAYPHVTSSGGSICAGTGTHSGTTSAAGGGSGHTHSSAEGTAFTGNAVACMPWYHALCYIQKI